MFSDSKTQKRLSHRIDPAARNLRGLEKRLSRLFPERQIIMRTGERMRTLRLSTMRQTVVASIAGVLGIWLLTSSGLVLGHNESIREKNQEVSRAKQSYEQLLAQVSLYRQKVSDITSNLEQNYDRTIALVEEQAGLASLNTPEGLLSQAARQSKPEMGAGQAPAPSDTALPDPGELEVALGNTQLERDHYEQERVRLKDRLGRLETELLDLESPQSAAAMAASQMDGQTGGVEYRRTVLERDLALAERQELATRVEELEAIVNEMESTQLLLFHKFAELADANISHIEGSLSGTDLDVGTLLDKRAKESPISQGGPFIPLDVVPGEEGPLQRSLISLNGKIDHWTRLRDLLGVMPLTKPMKKYWLSSGFGVRKDPFTGRYARHNGLDFGSRYGSPIYSPGEGKVVYAGWRGMYGRFVEIDHGMGIHTRYGHMSKISVEKGDVVGRGAELGRVGSSGRSTGPHLHYEVFVNGRPVDPLKFLKAGTDVFEG